VTVNFDSALRWDRWIGYRIIDHRIINHHTTGLIYFRVPTKKIILTLLHNFLTCIIILEKRRTRRYKDSLANLLCGGPCGALRARQLSAITVPSTILSRPSSVFVVGEDMARSNREFMASFVRCESAGAARRDPA